jgi:hypothetical protein
MSNASRQPCASISAWASGRKMNDASAATSVNAVIARRRSPASGNHLAITMKAGS